jgi:chemotaxis protein methyltransferase CheR
MEASEFYQLSELIYEYCGIDYRNNLPSLKSKVTTRLKELDLSCWEYKGYLQMDAREWDILIELITVNETFFFREENLLDEFANMILPLYKDRSAKNPLRIWCAACSTGEEPYTLGMLIEESGLFEPGAVRIVATDINKKVLKKAKSGLYNKKSFSFRKMPEGSLEKFFVEYEEEYKVKDSISEMVDFRHINLLDKNIAGKIEKADIILCRNVLIYFDHEAIQTIVDSFDSILKPKGILFLGHSESLTFYQHDFTTIYTEKIFYYRKGDSPLCNNTEC